jgi:thiamine biosynthesis lipoprotein
MRKVAHIMSMPIAIEIDGLQDNAFFNTLFNRFKQIENRFNYFNGNSEVSLYNRGDLKLKDTSSEFKKVFIECKRYKKQTNGYFDVFYKNRYNPSGYVKGWAIKEVAKLIKKGGYKNFFINTGGDILTSSDGKKTWKVGLQNPLNKTLALTTLQAKNLAVATSGNYARGKHIINPATGKPADEFLSVTVLGKDIIKADVLATAIFAAGKNFDQLAKLHPGYKALVIDQKGKITT